MTRNTVLCTFILGFLIFLGCSAGGNNPAGPGFDLPDPYDLRLIKDSEGHVIWGIYEFYIDPEDMSVEVIPAHKGNPHWPVTDKVLPPECMHCLTVVMTDFDSVNRIATLDISLMNPTNITGYDVRGILLLNDAGHDILNPDGWTAVFDDGTPPYFNPFKRYAKLNEFGAFPGGETYTETVLLYVPKPPNYGAIDFIIEAVWPKNSPREPYNITGEQLNGDLFSDGSNTVTLSVAVLDRNDDVLMVTIESPDLFSGTKDMTQEGDSEIWNVEFSNENLAPIGLYDVTVEAHDQIVSHTLRDKVRVSVIENTLNWEQNLMMQGVGECSFDIAAADGGLFDRGGFLVDAQSECAGFYGFDETFSIPTPVVSLIDLNPNNLTLQPYPPARFDSALSGGLAFSNSSKSLFQEGLNSIPMDRITVSLDGMLMFQDDMAGDDSAHYPTGESDLVVADVCDGFEARFYILWVSEQAGVGLPIIRAYKENYTTKKQVIGTTIPVEFLGPDDGQIVNNAESILGIDAYEVDNENVEFCILEDDGDGAQVEVFNLNTDSSGITEVTHIRTLDLPAELGEACDIELLPPNPDYEPNPDAVSMVITFRFQEMDMYVGYVNIYDLQTSTLIDFLGDLEMPSLFEYVRYLDINNSTFTILITSEIQTPEMMNMLIFTFSYM